MHAVDTRDTSVTHMHDMCFWDSVVPTTYLAWLLCTAYRQAIRCLRGSARPSTEPTYFARNEAELKIDKPELMVLLHAGCARLLRHLCLG